MGKGFGEKPLKGFTQGSDITCLHDRDSLWHLGGKQSEGGDE